MRSVIQWTLLVAAGSLTLMSCATGQSQQGSSGSPMSFFITSVGLGKGGDSADSKARTGTASPWPRQRVPGTAPGAPT